MKRTFTGWKVVAAGSLVWALQSMMWIQGYGNLAVELRDHFGWTKTLFAVGFASTRALSAFMGPAQGQALERFGTKRIIRTGAIIVLLGFIALSLIQTQAQFVAVLVFTTVGMTLMGFLTITAATVGWFERKRARALSVQTMGFAIGGFAGPLVVAGYAVFGWRATTAVSGVVLALVAWRTATILGRTRAETGEPVDGLDESEVADHPRAEGVSDRHFTASQAIRTRAFWMISLGHASALLVVSAVMAHLTLYLTEDRGYSAGTAALVAGTVPMFQLVGTGLGGLLGDRVNKRLISGIAMCAHGVALLILTWIDTGVAVAVFVVLHGLAWGARGPQMQAIRADYFGATSFARIMGWSALIVTGGSVIGPMIAGVLADSTGNYQLGFTIIAFGAIAGTAFWIFATPPSTDTDKSAKIAS